MRTRATDGLARARELADRLRTDPPADALGALEVWDELSLELSNVAAVGSLLSNVHPLEAVRDVAERAEQDAMRLLTELSLDRALYDVFAGLDRTDLDAQAGRLLDKVLETFTRSGVDRDDETRARVAAINERVTEIDQEFGRNIRDDVRTIRVTADRLDGMPADWLAAHPADDEGLVTVTTDYPDAIPVRMFAHDPEVRRDLTVQFLTRGWPQNEPLLTELFDLRHEMATLVGYDDWASYDADVKMIGKGPAIPEFIDRIAAAAEEPMRRDLEALLERYRRDVPDATGIDSADGPYYQELVRKEQYDVDSQEVRTYFGFDGVRQGLLDVTGRLFGLRYEPVTDVVLWADDVTAYDVHRVDDGAHLGRIFLDLHPREGKYKHAAQFTLTEGVAGRQLPEGVLVCNFPRRADGARPRRHALPRVRPPRPPRARRSRPLDPVRRRRHRVGLRRGAQPDARGVGLGRRGAADVRDRRGRRADPGRAGGADAPGRRLRQGRSRRAPRCSTRRCPTCSTPSGPPTCARGWSSCRSGTRRSPTSTTPGCSRASATSAATARRTTPTCGRW